MLTTILSGSTEMWRHDIEIPKKYGVDVSVGDTRGPSGIFRFLRTINPMLEIVRDMEHYCPGAVLLNYTNPMAMLCRLAAANLHPVTGLCHSVQGTAMMLAEWIGAPFSAIDYLCAGINHQAWYLEFKWNGVGRLSLIHKAITERPEIYNEEIVRNEMYLAIGIYRNGIQRPQFRIQLVVPQTPRPDRKILHAWHGLESRRVCLHSEGIPAQRGHLEGPGQRPGWRSPSLLKTCSAGMNTPPTSSTPCRAATCSSSTAMCPTHS